MKYPQGRISVFSKAPILGQVKTRLSSQHHADFSLALHSSLTLHCLTTVETAQLCPVQLWCSPDCKHEFFQQCQKDFSLTLHPQRGNDLGQRLASGFESILSQNSYATSYAIIVGTDCPYLTAEYLDEALRFLDQGGEAVLGPANDGGYVLIGLRQPCNDLFSNINWGHDQVMSETKQRINSLGLDYLELDALDDVDRPADLILLRKKIKSMVLHKDLSAVLIKEFGPS